MMRSSGPDDASVSELQLGETFEIVVSTRRGSRGRPRSRAASFNNPTTREWYESELQRPDVCFVYRRCGTRSMPGGRLLRVLEGRRPDPHQQPGDSARVARARARRGCCWRACWTKRRDSARRTPRSKCGARTRPPGGCTSGAGFELAGVRTSYYTNPIEDALILSRTGGRVPVLGAGRIPHPTPEGRRSTMAEAQDLKHLLLETNEEYRQLAAKHHELDDRLHELSSKHYLSRLRASRRSHPEETQTPAQRPDGGRSRGRTGRHLPRHRDLDCSLAIRSRLQSPLR